MVTPGRAVHFFVGNIAAHPRTFLLLGLFRPTIEALEKPGARSAVLMLTPSAVARARVSGSASCRVPMECLERLCVVMLWFERLPRRRPGSDARCLPQRWPGALRSGASAAVPRRVAVWSVRIR